MVGEGGYVLEGGGDGREEEEEEGEEVGHDVTAW